MESSKDEVDFIIRRANTFFLVDVDGGHFISVEIYLYGENVINR
jgi:hypothetical protein